MFDFRRILIAAGVSAIAAAPVVTHADPTMGQLVYSFSYGSDQKIVARDSNTNAQNVDPNGNISGGNNGMSHYSGSLSDKGTMTVNLIQQSSDGGLVVQISEQGENIHRAPLATCVVYGNTNVLCDPNKTVYTEEYTLLRFLGSNFFDPTQLDAKKHWSIVQNGGKVNVSADYTVNGDNNGMMQIGENRTVRAPGGGSLTTDIQTRVDYDSKRSVPTFIDEYVTQRHDNGVVGTSTTIYQTTLNLVSDSMAKT
jgi:hypothetical protein